MLKTLTLCLLLVGSPVLAQSIPSCSSLSFGQMVLTDDGGADLTIHNHMCTGNQWGGKDFLSVLEFDEDGLRVVVQYQGRASHTPDEINVILPVGFYTEDTFFLLDEDTSRTIHIQPVGLS